MLHHFANNSMPYTVLHPVDTAHFGATELPMPSLSSTSHCSCANVLLLLDSAERSKGKGNVARTRPLLLLVV
jgi:hypothetical protein